MAKRHPKRMSEGLSKRGQDPSLSEILLIPDRECFMISLAHFVTPLGEPRLGGWDTLLRLDPEPRLVLTLDCLASSLFSSGTSKFLIEARPLFEESIAACDLIGASRAVSFLRRVMESFPGGVLPTSAEECGDMIIEDASGLAAKLRALDVEDAAGVYDEIIDCLRRYVAANVGRFSRSSPGLH
jgi:hypothetical protein